MKLSHTFELMTLVETKATLNSVTLSVAVNTFGLSVKAIPMTPLPFTVAVQIYRPIAIVVSFVYLK